MPTADGKWPKGMDDTRVGETGRTFGELVPMHALYSVAQFSIQFSSGQFAPPVDGGARRRRVSPSTWKEATRDPFFKSVSTHPLGTWLHQLDTWMVSQLVKQRALDMFDRDVVCCYIIHFHHCAVNRMVPSKADIVGLYWYLYFMDRYMESLVLGCLVHAAAWVSTIPDPETWSKEDDALHAYFGDAVPHVPQLNCMGRRATTLAPLLLHKLRRIRHEKLTQEAILAHHRLRATSAQPQVSSTDYIRAEEYMSLGIHRKTRPVIRDEEIQFVRKLAEGRRRPHSATVRPVKRVCTDQSHAVDRCGRLLVNLRSTQFGATLSHAAIRNRVIRLRAKCPQTIEERRQIQAQIQALEQKLTRTAEIKTVSTSQIRQVVDVLTNLESPPPPSHC